VPADRSARPEDPILAVYHAPAGDPPRRRGLGYAAAGHGYGVSIHEGSESPRSGREGRCVRSTRQLQGFVAPSTVRLRGRGLHGVRWLARRASPPGNTPHVQAFVTEPYKPFSIGSCHRWTCSFVASRQHTRGELVVGADLSDIRFDLTLSVECGMSTDLHDPFEMGLYGSVTTLAADAWLPGGSCTPPASEATALV